MSDILTATELAERLKVSVDDVYRKAGENKIPAMKWGGDWRFDWESVLKSLEVES